jgi:hypothetical protein
MKLFKLWRLSRAPFYKQYPPRNRSMLPEINQRTVVDRRRGFIYFRIPKAANSTVMVNLTEADMRGQTTSKHVKRAFARVDTLSRQEVAELSSRFFLFTVVRNPYSRLVSSYLDKIARGKRSGQVLQALGKQAGAEIGFLEFCRYLQRGGVDDDPHWYRQVDLIPCGAAMLQAVGRTEHLGEDLTEILRRINGVAPQELASWTPHQTGANSKLGQFYCEESMAIVRQVYAEDFAAFGYSTDPLW